MEGGGCWYMITIQNIGRRWVCKWCRRRAVQDSLLFGSEGVCFARRVADFSKDVSMSIQYPLRCRRSKGYHGVCCTHRWVPWKNRKIGFSWCGGKSRLWIWEIFHEQAVRCFRISNTIAKIEKRASCAQCSTVANVSVHTRTVLLYIWNSASQGTTTP